MSDFDLRRVYGNNYGGIERRYAARGEAHEILGRVRADIERLRSLGVAADLWGGAWDFTIDAMRTCAAEAAEQIDGKIVKKGGMVWSTEGPLPGRPAKEGA